MGAKSVGILLPPDGCAVPRKTRTRADKARQKIANMVKEIRAWQGKDPTIVRVTMADVLALTECGYLRDGKLSGTDLEVRAG